MFSDTMFRVVNIAGGLDLDADLWRRHVMDTAPDRARTGAIRRRIEAALGRDETTTPRPVGEAVAGGLGRVPA